MLEFPFCVLEFLNPFLAPFTGWISSFINMCFQTHVSQGETQTPTWQWVVVVVSASQYCQICHLVPQTPSK